jgi:hypothetical protein
LWKAEDEARAQASRGDEQLEQARELVRQTKDALDTARRQYELARKIAETQAVFSVDAALGLYEDVRERLTPSGAPAPERLRLRYYMAVFERLGVLIDQGTVSPETANKFYGSRFKALVNDQGAVDIVTGDREGWVSFLSLWRALKTDRGLRDPDHL